MPQQLRRKYDGLSMEEKMDEVLQILDSIMGAFPDGPLKHREAHESWIAAKKAEMEFWQELKIDIAKKGAFGLITIICGLVIVGIATKLGVTYK